MTESMKDQVFLSRSTFLLMKRIKRETAILMVGKYLHVHAKELLEPMI
jgi:hypothetical protein